MLGSVYDGDYGKGVEKDSVEPSAVSSSCGSRGCGRSKSFGDKLYIGNGVAKDIPTALGGIERQRRMAI